MSYIDDANSYSTKIAVFKERKKDYDEFLEALNNHIKIGCSMQSIGVGILKEIRNTNINDDKLLRLTSNCSAIIDKGVTIEKNARDKIRELKLLCPK